MCYTVIYYDITQYNTPRCASVPAGAPRTDRKGTNGVSTNGVTANCMFLFDRGTFWVLPLTYFYLPKSARAYLFPRSAKMHDFSATPLVLTPFVRSQTQAGTTRWPGALQWGYQSCISE